MAGLWLQVYTSFQIMTCKTDSLIAIMAWAESGSGLTDRLYARDMFLISERTFHSSSWIFRRILEIELIESIPFENNCDNQASFNAALSQHFPNTLEEELIDDMKHPVHETTAWDVSTRLNETKKRIRMPLIKQHYDSAILPEIQEE
jgi:hypothetical protein